MPGSDQAQGGKGTHLPAPGGFLTQVGTPGLKDVFSRGCTTRCKPSLFFRVEVETNITWFRGGNIGPAPESPAPRRRKRLRWAAESRGCVPLDHGDPGEAPAGELWRQTQEHPSPPRLAASPSAAPSCTRLRGLPRVICRTPHPLPQPRPFLRARRRLLRPQRALPGGATPLRLLISGGRACGQRGPGPGGQLPELVPAGRTGAESQGEWGAGWRRARRGSGRGVALTGRSPRSGGGEPAGHGGRLRHGGPGERAARGAAVRGAAGRTSVAAHLLNQRPAGARWLRRRGWDAEAGLRGRPGP